MQIISLNRRDTKMSKAEMDSTRKTTLGSVEKSLVVTIIKLLQHLPCLYTLATDLGDINSLEGARA